VKTKIDRDQSLLYFLDENNKYGEDVYIPFHLIIMFDYLSKWFWCMQRYLESKYEITPKSS